jgi:hypothetical protein
MELNILLFKFASFYNALLLLGQNPLSMRESEEIGRARG